MVPLLQRRQQAFGSQLKLEPHSSPCCGREKLELLLVWVVVSSNFTALWSHCGGVSESWVGHGWGQLSQTPQRAAEAGSVVVHHALLALSHACCRA